MDDGQRVIIIAQPELCSGELKIIEHVSTFHVNRMSVCNKFCLALQGLTVFLFYI